MTVPCCHQGLTTLLNSDLTPLPTHPTGHWWPRASSWHDNFGYVAIGEWLSIDLAAHSACGVVAYVGEQRAGSYLSAPRAVQSGLNIHHCDTLICTLAN